MKTKALFAAILISGSQYALAQTYCDARTETQSHGWGVEVKLRNISDVDCSFYVSIEKRDQNKTDRRILARREPAPARISIDPASGEPGAALALIGDGSASILVLSSRQCYKVNVRVVPSPFLSNAPPRDRPHRTLKVCTSQSD